MTISDREAHEFAARLRTAERDGSAMLLASETFTDLGWDDARRIAVARDQLRRSDGDECIGYKLGWTSSAMRNAFGIDRPNWGTLWRSQLVEHHLDLSRLRHAKVEPEIVFTAGGELGGADVTADDVLDSSLGWAIGIEVVHPRWPSFDFTWLDNTADNSSAAAIAVGPICQLSIELAAVEISFSNGRETRTGRGDQALDSPAEAVAWLVRALAVEGRSIHTRQIVFTGGLTAPFDVLPGSHFLARSSDLGTIEVAADDIAGP